jgi:UDP-N-acetylmuramate--alanine ligase
MLQPHIKKIHFIGIGGISMSGLAEILHHERYIISGSDMMSSPTTQKLSLLGIQVDTPHHQNHIKNPDLVVYTAAIKEDNPELTMAKSKKIPTMDRASLLGELMHRYHFSIACSGTHGKTTTTSMVSSILIEAGVDPTIHIGGILPSINHSTKVGSNDYFVTEACEYMDSFLKFSPSLAILSNIELDHLDYFKSIHQVKQSFVNFTKNIPATGFVIVNLDDSHVVDILEKIQCNVISYGIQNHNATWQARDIQVDDWGLPTFSVYRDNHLLIEAVSLSIPGMHNISNALSAICSCVISVPNIHLNAIRSALKKFTGASRRFEIKGSYNGIQIIDDYAHHPTEIKTTLTSARLGKYNRIFCIFQPHTFTRTKSLLDDFASSFEDADKVIVADIYAAREKNIENIDSSLLQDKLLKNGKDAIYIKTFDEISKFILLHAQKGDLVITMGAGNIGDVAQMILSTSEYTEIKYVPLGAP